MQQDNLNKTNKADEGISDTVSLAFCVSEPTRLTHHKIQQDREKKSAYQNKLWRELIGRQEYWRCC